MAATKLVFTTQPDGAVTGVALTQQPVVKAVNAVGQVDATFSGNVTVAVYGGSGSLSGTATVAASSGVATFTNLVLTGAGHTVLKASASGLTDGRSGMATVMPAATAAKTVLSFGANTGDKVDCGSGSSINNLGAGTMTVVSRFKRTAAGNNQFLASKYNTGNTGWAFSTGDSSISGGVIVNFGRVGGNAIVLSGTGNGVTNGNWYDAAFTWDVGDATRQVRIFLAPVGTALSEVTVYDGATTQGSGAALTDAAANLWLGNLQSFPTNPFKGSVEWVAVFSTKLTAAQMLQVQIGMDRNNAAMITNVGNCVGLWQCNNATTVADQSGNSNTGTVTTATTTTGETVHAPTVWADCVDASDQTTYLFPGSHAYAEYTSDATSVIAAVYRQTADSLSTSTYDPQCAVAVDVNGAYDSQILAPAVNLQYVTRSLPAGSAKRLRFTNSVDSRLGSAGTGTDGIGVGVVSLRFNQAATRIAPTTPALHVLEIGDSIPEGFRCDPVGQHGPLDQLRRYLEGLTPAWRLSCAGYGGNTLYAWAKDSTTRTATVNFLKRFNPNLLVFEVGGGANDYLNSIWSAANFQTALDALLTAIIAEFPNLLIYVPTMPTIGTGEGPNSFGDAASAYRTATLAACSGKANVTTKLGPTELFAASAGQLSADGVHPNNTGGDAITGLIEAWPLPPAALVADFTGTPLSGNTPLNVAFTDASTGAPTAWLWDFGDGGSSTSQSPSHSYSSPGTYTVTLTAANPLTNAQKVRTNYVTAGSPPPPPAPVADFSGTPTSGDAPLNVTFTDLSTNTPTSWLWDFGDSTTSTLQNPSHSYAAGTYTVSLTATNAGGSDQKTRTGYITASPPPPPPPPPTPPVADFSGSPTVGVDPLTVVFTDLSTNSPTSWSWDFGDSGTSTKQNPTHQYSGAGTYTVVLQATNADGSDTKTKTNYITVISSGGSSGGRKMMTGAG